MDQDHFISYAEIRQLQAQIAALQAALETARVAIWKLDGKHPVLALIDQTLGHASHFPPACA